MVGLGTYIFKIINTEKIIPDESFTNAYVEEVYESEHVRTATKQLCLTLDAKYKGADLHEVMETQRQYVIIEQCNGLLNYYRIYRSCSMKHLVPV